MTATLPDRDAHAWRRADMATETMPCDAMDKLRERQTAEGTTQAIVAIRSTVAAARDAEPKPRCRKHGPTARIVGEFGRPLNACLACGRVQSALPTRFGNAHQWREPWGTVEERAVTSAIAATTEEVSDA